MQFKKLSLVFCSLGAFILFFYTIFSFLWLLVGLGPPLFMIKGALALFGAFAPPIGAFLMVIGGFIFGTRGKEASK